MNVLRQNLASRLMVITMVTLVVCLGFYFLEFTGWAETIREAMMSREPEEPRDPRGYIGVVFGSLLKACVLIGVPLLITLGNNRLRLMRRS